MNARKVIGFLFLKPAFTQRNITSILLVGVFFLVFVLMGGKFPAVPLDGKPTGGGGFGAMLEEAKKFDEGLHPLPGKGQGQTKTDHAAKAEDESESDEEKLLGLEPSSDREARNRASLGKTLFDEEERKELEQEKIDKKGLIQGYKFVNKYDEWRLKRSEPKSKDGLGAIEDRLQINRNK